MRNLFSFLMIVALGLLYSSASFAQQTNAPIVSAQKKQSETPPVTVVAVDYRIKVMNAPIGSRLEVYSVVGIKVAEIELKQANGEYTTNIAKGYYIVRIGETVRKIAIR
jgi:hypothetical protein